MEIEPNETAPGDQVEVDTPIGLQEAKSKQSGRRLAKPERVPATRRNVEDEGQVPLPKTGRLSEDVMDTGRERRCFNRHGS